MRRLRADDCEQVAPARMHHHFLSDQRPRIKATGLHHPQKAARFNSSDNQSDLVHVCGKQYAGPAPLATACYLGHHIAHDVDLDRLCVAAQVRHDDVAHRAFKTGPRMRGHQLF
ncbi:hypothetical protein GCM10025858_02200 [Alicyclobacillus sacchari]|nr:hypothetical protein GCM10025858_02200 [Alicyclobacillus sacchari]